MNFTDMPIFSTELAAAVDALETEMLAGVPDGVVSGIADEYSADLGESPEALRGAIIALTSVSAVAVEADLDDRSLRLLAVHLAALRRTPLFAAVTAQLARKADT